MSRIHIMIMLVELKEARACKYILQDVTTVLP
jgi:hypothetical protein